MNVAVEWEITTENVSNRVENKWKGGCLRQGEKSMSMRLMENVNVIQKMWMAAELDCYRLFHENKKRRKNRVLYFVVVFLLSIQTDEAGERIPLFLPPFNNTEKKKTT